jgi:hypothetical protein
MPKDSTWTRRKWKVDARVPSSAQKGLRMAANRKLPWSSPD